MFLSSYNYLQHNYRTRVKEILIYPFFHTRVIFLRRIRPADNGSIDAVISISKGTLAVPSICEKPFIPLSSKKSQQYTKIHCTYTKLKLPILLANDLLSFLVGFLKSVTRGICIITRHL